MSDLSLEQVFERVVDKLFTPYDEFCLLPEEEEGEESIACHYLPSFNFPEIYANPLSQCLAPSDYHWETIATAPITKPLPQKLEKEKELTVIMDGFNALLYQSSPKNLSNTKHLIKLVTKNVTPLLKFFINYEIHFVIKGFNLGKIPWKRVMQTILATINYGLGHLASKLRMRIYVMEPAQNDKGRDDRMVEILQDRLKNEGKSAVVVTNDKGRDRATHWDLPVSYTETKVEMTDPGRLKIEDLLSRFQNLSTSTVKTVKLGEVDDDAFIFRLVSPNDFPRFKFEINHNQVRVAEHVY